MGFAYRLTPKNWRRWVADFKSSGEKPDISDPKYRADRLTYIHKEVTDWDYSDVEWLNIEEN